MISDIKAQFDSGLFSDTQNAAAKKQAKALFKARVIEHEAIVNKKELELSKEAIEKVNENLKKSHWLLVASGAVITVLIIIIAQK